jgi:metallo-beta-lactamase class B
MSIQSLVIGKHAFSTYYPGPGHAPDNIVILFETERVLYGGCLVKSVDDSSLRNLSDANLPAHPKTIRNLINKCKRPRYIIPGHNDWKNTNSLKHTLQMAQVQAGKNGS